jgi:hypothetical protein
MNRRRNPEVTYTLGTTEYRLTGEGRDPVIHVRRRGGDFYVLPASSLGPREYARVFREWANVTKRRNPAAGWTFTIAPSPGQRVRAKRIVSLWNGTMVGNVATFETATEARLAASQMDDDGIRWTRSNPRRRNPAEVNTDGLPPRAPRGHVRIYTVNGGDMMETPTRRFDNQFDAVAHATRTGRPYFVVEDVSKERARRYGVG